MKGHVANCFLNFAVQAAFGFDFSSRGGRDMDSRQSETVSRRIGDQREPEGPLVRLWKLRCELWRLCTSWGFGGSTSPPWL